MKAAILGMLAGLASGFSRLTHGAATYFGTKKRLGRPGDKLRRAARHGRLGLTTRGY